MPPSRAVRAAIGRDVALMIDANHAYDADAAIQLGRQIEPICDIGWFEEPVPPEDLAGYVEVRARSRSRSPAASASSPASASASCWCGARSTWSSRTPATRAGSRNA